MTSVLSSSPSVLDRVEDAADLVVAMRQAAGVDLHHVGEDLLLVGVERIPRAECPSDRGVSFVFGGTTPSFFCRAKRLLAHLVPALVELALELRDPLLRRVMRRVGRARRVVGEERLVRRDGVLHADPLDGVVGHVLVEEVVLRVVRRLDGLGALEERRRPLARVAADEAVEVFEAQPGRPQIERPGLAGLPVGHVVVLAEPGGVVAVLLEHLGERPGALRHQRVVAGEAGAELHDDAGGDASDGCGR